MKLDVEQLRLSLCVLAEQVMANFEMDTCIIICANESLEHVIGSCTTDRLTRKEKADFCDITILNAAVSVAIEGFNGKLMLKSGTGEVIDLFEVMEREEIPKTTN